MRIFGDFAPRYWAARLPVIPLKKWNAFGKGAGKAPILNEWQSYAAVMPSESMQQLWLESYPEHNIGLPFGPASGLCAIDIDTEDEELVQVILDTLPQSPWERVGKKGMGLVYRWKGQRNFKLRDSENKSIVEFLGQGNQMVLPPSIHPDTGKPYEANCDLWDVLDRIPALDEDVEQDLRDALGDVLKSRGGGVTLAQGVRSRPLDVIPQGERDIQMVRHAGYLARVVLGIDRTTKYSLTEAIDHMTTWVLDFTASAAGDDMDPGKGVAKLLEFLLKDVEGGRTLPDGWDVGLSDEQREWVAIKALIEKNQVQRWTLTKARDWIDARAAEDPNDTDRLVSKIGELFLEVGKDDNFGSLESDGLINYIKSRFGKETGIGKPALARMLKEARQESSGDGEMAADHESIAREVIEEMSRGGELKFSQGCFWQWGGSCFGQVDHEDVYVAVATGVKGNVLSRRHNDYEAIVKTISRLCRSELIEEYEIGINFANGFLDSGGVLHDHSPKYGKTFTMPFNYVPERAGEAHKWLAYLESAWGDDEDYAEKVMALQEAFAATMFGIAPRFQRAFLLYGKAKTGKSQALEVLQAMMPPKAICTLSPERWGQRFQLSGMVGRTLNVCGELPEETVIDGKAFKEVVEGATQSTEFKGRDGFSFAPIAAHWFASNHLPRSRDTSMGFVRRWQIFDFEKVVAADERIPDYHEVLVAEEREAIAAWAVQGLQRLLRQNDYTQPKSHLARLEQIQRANNSVAAWLQSNDKVRPTGDLDDAADARECFDQYVFYMREVSRGFNVTFERFLQMMEELGFPQVPYEDKAGIKRAMFRRVRIKGLGEV